MNKLLTLVNIELKRNSRFYIVYLIGFSFLTLLLTFMQTNNFKRSLGMLENMIKSYGGVTFGSAIMYNNMYIDTIIGTGIVGFLIYSVYMWVREYTQSNKSIYSLIMIPSDKFYIYLSKMVAVITMVYGYLVTQLISLFIAKNIFNLYFRKLSLIKTSLTEDLAYGELGINGSDYFGINLLPINFAEFIMNYVVILILIISVIFLLAVITMGLRENVKYYIITPIVVLGIAYFYIGTRFSMKTYSILGSLLVTNYNIDLVINIITVIIINIISYLLINKKLYI